MALAVRWKTTRNGQESTWLGSPDLDTPLEDLHFQFGKATGALVDPYGNARLSAEQGNRLVALASPAGLPHRRTEADTSRHSRG
jgi:hypothetical protein